MNDQPNGAAAAPQVASDSYNVTVSPVAGGADSQLKVSTEPAKRQIDAATEIYKIYVGTAESNIERRLKLNQYYYSIVAAIIVAYAYLAEGRFKVPTDSKALVGEHPLAASSLWLLPCLLLLISIAWCVQLYSLRLISKTKFATIEALELNLSVAPFRLENEKREGTGFLPSGTTIEMCVPIALGLMAAVNIVMMLLPWLTRLRG